MTNTPSKCPFSTIIRQRPKISNQSNTFYELLKILNLQDLDQTSPQKLRYFLSQITGSLGNANELNEINIQVIIKLGKISDKIKSLLIAKNEPFIRNYEETITGELLSGLLKEQAFYDIHIGIEKSGFDLVIFLHNLIENDKIDIQNLDVLIEKFKSAILEMKLFLTPEFKEDFQELRPFYSGDIEKDIPGPSGLYSALFRTFEILLLPELSYDLLTNIELLPTGIGFVNQKMLLKSINLRENVNILPIQFKNNAEILERFKKIRHVMVIFSILHEIIAKFNIPQLSKESNSIGTGGISAVLQFLAAAIVNRKK